MENSYMLICQPHFYMYIYEQFTILSLLYIISDDHNYALSTFLEDDSTVHVSMESSLSSVQTPVLVKPVHAEPGITICPF